MNQGTPKRNQKTSISNKYEISITDRLTLTDSTAKQNINSRNQFLSPNDESSKSQLSSYRDRRINVTPTNRNSSLRSGSTGNYEVIEASPTLLNNKHGIITTFLEENPKVFTSPKNYRNGYYKIEDAKDKKQAKMSELKVTPDKINNSQNTLKIDYSGNQYSINNERNYKIYNGGVVNFFDASDDYRGYNQQEQSSKRNYPETKKVEEKNFEREYQKYEIPREKVYERNHGLEEFEYDRNYYDDPETEREHEEFQYDQTNYDNEEENMDNPEYQYILNKIRHNFLYNFGGGKVLSPVTEQKSMEDKYDSTGYIFHSKISSSLKDFHNNLSSNLPHSSKYSISHDRAALGSLDQKQALYLLTSLNKQNIDRRMTFDVHENKRASIDNENSNGNITSRSQNLSKENHPPAMNQKMKKKSQACNVNLRKLNCPDSSIFGTGEETILEEITPIKNYEVEAVKENDHSMIGTNTLNSTYEYECDVLTERSVNKLIGNIEIHDRNSNSKNSLDRESSGVKQSLDNRSSQFSNEEEEKKIIRKHYFGRKKFNNSNRSKKRESIENDEVIWKREYDEKHKVKKKYENDKENQTSSQRNIKAKNSKARESAQNFDLMVHTSNNSRNSSIDRKSSKRKINYDIDNSDIRNLRNLDSMSPRSSSKASDFRLKEESVNDLAKTIKTGFPKPEINQNRMINFYDDPTSNDLRKTTQLFKEKNQVNEDNFTPIKAQFFNINPSLNFINIENREPRGSKLEKNYTSRSKENSVEVVENRRNSKSRTPVVKKIFRRRSKSPVRIVDEEVDNQVKRNIFNVVKSPEVSHRWGEDLNDQEPDPESLDDSQRLRKTIEKYNFNSKKLRDQSNNNSIASSLKKRKLKPESLAMSNEGKKVDKSIDEIFEQIEEPNQVVDFSGKRKSNVVKTFRDNNNTFVNDLLNSTTTPRSKLQLQQQNNLKKEDPFVRKKSMSSMKVKKQRMESRSQVSSCDSNKQLKSELNHTTSVQSTFVHHSSQFSSMYMKSRKTTPIDDDNSYKKRAPIKSSQIQSELAESIYGKSELKFNKQPSVMIAIEDAEEESKVKFHHSEKIVIDSADEDNKSRISFRTASEDEISKKTQSEENCKLVHEYQSKSVERSREERSREERSREDSIRSFGNIPGFASNLQSMERVYPQGNANIIRNDSVMTRTNILNSVIKNSESRSTLNQPTRFNRNTSTCSRRSYQVQQINPRNLTPVIQSRRFVGKDNRHSYVVSKRSITPIRKEINLKTSLQDKFSSVKNPVSTPLQKTVLANFNSHKGQIHYKKLDINSVDVSKYRIFPHQNFNSNETQTKIQNTNLANPESRVITNSTKMIQQRSVTPTPFYASNKSYSNYNTCSKRSILMPSNSVQNNLKNPLKNTLNLEKRIVVDSRPMRDNRQSLNIQSGYFKTTTLQRQNPNFLSRKRIRNSSQDYLSVSRKSIEIKKIEPKPQVSVCLFPKKTRGSYMDNPLKRTNNLSLKKKKKDPKNSDRNLQVKGSVFESAFNIANLRKRQAVTKKLTLSKERENKNEVSANTMDLGRGHVFDKENYNANLNRDDRNSVLKEPFVKKIDFSNPKIWRDEQVEKKQTVNFYEKSSREPKKKNILSSRLNFGNVKLREERRNTATFVEKNKPYNFYCENRTNYFRRRRVDDN